MANDLRELKRQYRVEWAEMGEEQVRLTIERGLWSGTRLKWAIEWLGEADQRSRLRNEASSSEQIRVTRSAKNAAWAAAIAAIVAAIATIATVLIAYWALSQRS